MATVNEIAPDVFRISTYVEPLDLQFNQFLACDDEPLLFEVLREIFGRPTVGG